MTSVATPKLLIDRFGRTVDYLRISITDRCDFRCVYCMAEDMTFLPREQVLSLEEIYTLAKAFVELGVKKIRITGGEPLVRKGALELLENVGRINGLNELVITTNGSQLEAIAMDLKAAGIKRLNISLDTLDDDKFKAITRTGNLQQVLRGIQAAKQAGFERIKINAVVLKNKNHLEVCNLVQYALDNGLDISFIEEMPLGIVDQHDRSNAYYSSDLIKQDLGYLNIAPLQAAPSLKNPVINSIGQLIGVLYVVEGSTLGAQLIARSLEKHHGLNQTKGGRFFYGYGEETQKNWQDFISFIETLSDQPEQCTQALDSANQTFNYFNLMLKEYLTIIL